MRLQLHCPLFSNQTVLIIFLSANYIINYLFFCSSTYFLVCILVQSFEKSLRIPMKILKNINYFRYIQKFIIKIDILNSLNYIRIENKLKKKAYTELHALWPVSRGRLRSERLLCMYRFPSVHLRRSFGIARVNNHISCLQDDAGGEVSF